MTAQTASVVPLTDLVAVENGRAVLPPSVHHLPHLLDMDAEDVLTAFHQSQAEDFSAIIGSLADEGAPLHKFFADLRDAAGPDNPFARNVLFTPGALEEMFHELHGHVMAHPVWRHPFFLRVFRGEMTQAQLTAFAKHYFNQVKNTRQCVALSIGRFHGLMGMPFGVLNERLSELTQVVLAQLVADEYGVGSHEVEDYPTLEGLFRSTTHIVMYRQVFEGLGVPFAEQDVALLPEVADNVLTQRLVAGDRTFTPLESLSSVGLGMEWGVPEFFTLLLGGMIRWAHAERVPLTADHLLVFIAHVKYDVLHAVAVMAATALHMTGQEDVAKVKNAVNMLMSARYGMMSGMYRHVFGEDCPGIEAIDLAPHYRITDRRIETALRQARRDAAPSGVTTGTAYAETASVPFVFA